MSSSTSQSNLLKTLQDYPNQNECDRTHLPDLIETPWCRTILESSEYTRIPFASRDPTYNPTNDSNMFGLVRHTFATPSAIRTVVCLRRKNPENTRAAAIVSAATTAVLSSASSATLPSPPSPATISSSPILTEEILLLISLGTPTLSGWPGILHGGIIALLLDEILSVGAETVLGVEMRTAWLRTDYKREVSAPSIVLGKAWVERMEGRKAWVRGSLEDGRGGVLVLGEALFVKPRERGEVVPGKGKL